MAEPIDRSLRAEEVDARELIVRGNPLSVGALLDHARRTAAVFTWRGSALYAVSAAVTGPGRSLDDLLASTNLRTRSTYASARVAAVTAAGFVVLPTFAAPHVSIVWPKYDEHTAETLLAVLGPVCENPFREGRSR